MSFEPLKFIYNKHFYIHFLTSFKEVVPNLNIQKFTDLIFDNNWENRELKDRMKHTTFVLNIFLNSDFKIACKQIIQLTQIIDLELYKYGSLAFMFLPDYIETYGKNYFSLSMRTLKKITHFASSEFAVRPFIIQNQKKAINILLKWSKDKNYHVRRLASESCRPKLPWAIALKDLQKKPKPIIAILENLQNDTEDYVYRSVANNLNDISKNQPQLVLSIAKKWYGYSKTKDWIVKHSLRTLLRSGNQEAMKILGYGLAKDVKVSNFSLGTTHVQIGKILAFSFQIHSNKQIVHRLEYAIYFLRKNGLYSKKVFKISEKEFKKDSIYTITKKHSFKIISTRKYYLGKQKISIIIDGIEKELKDYMLIL